MRVTQKNTENFKFRPLDKITEIIQATGLDAGYAYDDLVFSEHAVFLLQFDVQKSDVVHLFFNHECEPESKQNIKNTLHVASGIHKIRIIEAGKFKLSQKEGNKEIDIEFNPK